MKILFKKLLPGKVKERVAQNFVLSKKGPEVSLKFVKKFRIRGSNYNFVTTKLTGSDVRAVQYHKLREHHDPYNFARISFLVLLIIFFLGYPPQVSIPPTIKSAKAYASYDFLQTQKEEIIASSFPQPIQLPHPGYLSSKFSTRHQAIDIASGLDMPVHPITKGEVVEVNLGFWGYGNHLIISHANGFKSLYGHLGRIFVKTGQQVTNETTIGEVGMSGWTSGPHTHLEIIHNNNYIDPLLILPEISDVPKAEYISGK